jgi:hypothetical protein
MFAFLYSRINSLSNRVSGINARMQDYKAFVAIINQSGVDDPTFTEVVNDFDGVITMDRNGAGAYAVENTLSEFTTDKTVIFCTGGQNDGVILAGRASGTEITLVSRDFAGVSADGIMSNAQIEIRVYP